MDNYSLTKVDIEGLRDAYILESDHIDRLLLDPGRRLLGYERQKEAFECTVTWFSALHDNNLFPEDTRELCTVTVLAEALGHNLPLALSAVLGLTRIYRGDNWIGASRFATDTKAKEGYTDFEAKVNYLRLHSIAPVWCMLDTVATGATLVRVLEAAFSNAPKPRKIFMATPAGSPAGMRKIDALCQKEGVELHISFFGAAFGLGDDGTALPWCHPQTILADTARAKKNRLRAGELFNELPDFCAVGDCSANFFDVEAALINLAEEEEKLGWQLPFDAGVLQQ